jgi:hypothetical protein
MLLTAAHGCLKLKLHFVYRRVGIVMCSASWENIAMRSICVVVAVSSSFVFGMASASDDDEIKLSDCPAPVRKTLQTEAKGAKIETVTKEKNEDGAMVYWAEVAIGGKTFAIGALEDGTLSEMNLAFDDDDLPFDRCPSAVQATFRSEVFGEKVEAVARDMKYGVIIYQTVIDHKGKSYEIVVAEDGTLVEKVLVIDDEEVKLADCPAAVRATLHEHARGGEIGDVTRSTGIGQHTFEAEVKIKDKVYLIEVAESGLLISKSLEAIKN